MRKTRPGECSECGRESRFLHDGECPVCRGETTELVLADHPEPAKPPSANVASPAAQSSPAPTPVVSGDAGIPPQPSFPKVDGLAEMIRRVDGEHTPAAQLPVDHVARAAIVLDLTRDTTGDAIAAMMRRAAIAALEALWLHWRLNHNETPAPAPPSRPGTAAAEEAKPAERNEPDRPSRPPTRAATIDRALDDTQLQTIADAYHHDLVSIGDLATQHQLTNARIRHIITRAGYPIRGRGDLNQRITQQLLDLGLTSHDVKTWALEEGLVDKMSRGTIAPALLTAYVAAHQPDTTKELSS